VGAIAWAAGAGAERALQRSIGMKDDSRLQITDTVSIPRAELSYRASRSGGPGGQHVNTTATRVELTWNVAASPSLTEEQRARVLERLASRIDSEGVLRLVASGFRSQHQSKKEVTDRFCRLVAASLHVPKRRKKTRPPRSAVEARLRAKKRRSAIKRARRAGHVDEA
jgi:ribosome-associated protein